VGSAKDSAADPIPAGYSPYDFGSIMHYPSHGGKSFETIPKGRKTGQRKELSKSDVDQVNDMYQCLTKTGPMPLPVQAEAAAPSAAQSQPPPLAAAATAVPLAAQSPPQQAKEYSFCTTISNIDYEGLKGRGLKPVVETVAKKDIAVHSGVKEEAVALQLSPGSVTAESVKIDSTLTLGHFTLEQIKTNVSTNKEDLENRLLKDVRAIDGISNVSNPLAMSVFVNVTPAVKGGAQQGQTMYAHHMCILFATLMLNGLWN